MKRAAEDCETTHQKRARTDSSNTTADPNFTSTLRRSFKYLTEHTKIEKPPGHIFGVVKMVQTLGSKFSLVLAPSVDRSWDLLEVHLAKLSLESLGSIKIKDKLWLSLKGGRIEKVQKKNHLPVRLLFTEGYCIRYAGGEINTFSGESTRFSNAPRPSQLRSKKVPAPKQLSAAPDPNGSSSSRASSPATGSTRLPKKDKRQKTRSENELETPLQPPAASAAGPSSALPVLEALAGAPVLVPNEANSQRPTKTPGDQRHPPPTVQSSASVHPPHSAQPCLVLPQQTNAGTQNAQERNPPSQTNGPSDSAGGRPRPPPEYKTLDALGSVPSGNMCNIIGVVVELSSPKQSNGGDKGQREFLTFAVLHANQSVFIDWSKKFRLSDPSKVSSSTHISNFPVNIFAKHLDLLPNPQLGDILILRRLKISCWAGGTNGIGYSNLAQWAIYSRKSRKIHYNGVETLNNALLPIYTPVESDLTYCAQLLDWWPAPPKEGEPVDASDPRRVSIVHGRSSRPHRLIKELQQRYERGFQEYFDCTVEVSHICLFHQPFPTSLLL